MFFRIFFSKMVKDNTITMFNRINKPKIFSNSICMKINLLASLRFPEYGYIMELKYPINKIRIPNPADTYRQIRNVFSVTSMIFQPEYLFYLLVKTYLRNLPHIRTADNY